MNISAYETALLRLGHERIIKDIQKKLAELYLREGGGGQGPFRRVEHPRENVYIPLIELLPSPHEIPPFGHPLPIEVHGEKMLVIDVRNYVRRAMNGDVAVTSEFDYQTLKLRAIAELAAAVDPSNLLSIGSLHTTVYIRWIADAIGKRLGLPPETQVRLTVLVGLFYVCQFIDFGETLDERERVKIAQIIGKATFVPVEDILRIIDTIEKPPAQSAYELLHLLQKYGESVRFEQLNIGLLYSILYMGSWFGSNKNENIALAVEHPPTFIGMVLAACEERGLRKSGIGELVKAYDKNGAAEGMVKIFWHLPMPTSYITVTR